MYRYLIALILIFTHSVQSTETRVKDTIFWFEFDSPPYYVNTSQTKQLGLGQLLSVQFQKSLPDYQHKVVRGNFVRALKQIQSQDNLCIASLVKSNVSQDHFYFSQAIIHILPNGLTVNNKQYNTYHPFVTDGVIDLEKLLTLGQFRLGTLKGRPYGPFIDDMLNKVDPRKRIIRLGGASKVVNLMDMLLKRNQVDGIIGDPAEFKYFSSLNRLKEDALSYFLIKGDMQLSPLYVGCSRSAKGKKIIDKI